MTQQPERPTDVRQFRVDVGHSSVTVSGGSTREAVREAKRRLCADMPRMWDVISAMDARQFQVTRLT